MKQKIKNWLREWWDAFMKQAEMEMRVRGGYWM